MFLAHVNKFSLSIFFVPLIIQCSVTCGHGYQARFIKCAEKVCIICAVLLILL